MNFYSGSTYASLLVPQWDDACWSIHSEKGTLCVYRDGVSANCLGTGFDQIPRGAYLIAFLARVLDSLTIT